MSQNATPRMLDALFRTDAIREVFSDRLRLQSMLDFEAALARACASSGLIPSKSAESIEAQCRADLFDIGKLALGARQAGNTAIPMVKALAALVEKADPDAARVVHWGATSQDAMDTGLVLQMRAAFDLLEADLGALAKALAKLALAHKATPMAGRTWMQQAVPVTFGLRVAGWLDAIGRHQQRMNEVRPRVLALQLGGAAGSLAAFGDRGLDIARAMATDLGLVLPDTPWHAQRDRIVEAAAALGLLTGTLGKIARDISLSMQTEVGEAFEPAGSNRGGSSTMPQKRNPVASAVALAAAARVPALVSTMLSAMVQEQERGLGGWHAEWETLPEIFMLTAGALGHMREAVEGLQVDAQRMRDNLDNTRGLILAEAVSMALAPGLGRLAAHERVEHACKTAATQGKALLDVLAADAQVTAHLSHAELERLLDPGHHLGLAGRLVDAVLAAHDGKRG